MNFIIKLKNWYVLIILGIIGAMFYNINKRINNLEDRLYFTSETVSLQMHESIEHWSDSFNIPKYIAYNLAYKETGYRGPFHWGYNPKQVSNMGAVGPMQIIPRYAHYFAGRKVTEKELMEDIDLNVKISMKMLRYWYNIHHDWTLSCGAYNSGKPIRNEYAVYISSTKNYINKWDRI
jgi:soluble lytic murein transglycosylase-like protein